MIEPEGYCREIEAYLCRKNDGHLVRISGPGFEQVRRWAQEGIPIKVAFTGIDRYFARYYRRGPRRRPVRVEFCEADVLDAFDAWRRAVGVSLPVASAAGADGATGASDGEEEPPTRKRGSLAAHIERTIARLTALRASALMGATFQDVLEHVSRELDALQPESKRARGDARDQVVARLVMLDRTVMTTVVASIDDRVRSAAEAEAKEALAPFRDRMAPEAYQRASVAALEKQVREHFGLPVIAFD